MKIEFDKSVIDLGYTPIENMFIHTYLSIANAEQIKVYIYALSHAYSQNGEDLTNDNIAFEMNLTNGQVIDAWNFWESKGLVEIRDDKYIFKSLRHGYVNQLMGIEEPAKVEKIEDLDMPEIDTGFKQMFDNIEEFMSQGRDIQIKLNPGEINRISEQIKTYNLTYDFFGYAFVMASQEVDSKNVAKILGVIRNWIIDGATDEQKLTDLLERKSQARDYTKSKKKQDKNNQDSMDKRMNPDERRRFIMNKMKDDDFKPKKD